MFGLISLTNLDENLSAAIDSPHEVLPLDGVRHVIAVASGKGGVGKSTVSVNLALAFAEKHGRTGLLDADIYGPNIPLMMGVQGSLAKESSGLIKPIIQHDVRLISIGFATGPSDAVIYRGPLVGKMVKSFLRNVAWGELDYLFVDLPPGTGDAGLTLAQSVKLTGVVVITTPQDVALSDVRKSIMMFKRLQVPILGIVENMSFYLDPNTGEKIYIFGSGGGRKLSDEFGLPFLGEIPLSPSICNGGDSGAPIFLNSVSGDEIATFRKIGNSVLGRIDN